ncbi:16S rRNA (cytosine(1402)-N(4))-methyltransferase RsmH [Helicobacter ibis]|uniref:Ribosomal RNA small subunit methyltransferase H n=1 Tax=Helicobacter ibis TaxID=2962633 RepID=A0ABT4VED7_9HELI|nr:16S rRNA (cytosine(1402)-N(4))-methyltransferase RsmH [Helicobacter ibis]MDA3969058.1 16S rRNA (cytosine(1402)-N(4))-methyltransferase RsmH [Helicobacter ibis]
MIPHISVLKDEIVNLFDTKLVNTGGTIIDCTLGYGGHTLALLEKYKNIKIIAIDKDIEAINLATKRLEKYKDRLKIINNSFSSGLKEALQTSQDAVGILADIGVSSMQFDNLERGFSFLSNTLDMRMNLDSHFSASEVVNNYSTTELERIFRDFGEIREYKKLARLIVETRKKEKIQSSKILSELIAKNFKNAKLHPATLAFQAIRIEVNNELGELQEMLNICKDSNLQHGSRIGIISFHSLEDRMIKLEFKKWEQSCICPSSVMKCICGNSHKLGNNIYKKPITPNAEELSNNNRARSAKLRAFEFIRN